MEKIYSRNDYIQAKVIGYGSEILGIILLAGGIQRSDNFKSLAMCATGAGAYVLGRHIVDIANLKISRQKESDLKKLTQGAEA